MENISISISLLENRGKYYEGIENGSILKDHVRRLKNGLQFLGKLYVLSIDERLADDLNHLAADVRHKLTAYEEENRVLDIIKLDREYEILRGMMTNLVIQSRYRSESFRIFQEDLDSKDNYRRIIDLLLENISEVQSTWYHNNNATTALVRKVRKLKMALHYYKPLYRCLVHPTHFCDALIRGPLHIVLNKAAVAIYLLLVGKKDEEVVVSSLGRVMNYDKRCRNREIFVKFLKFSSPESSSYVKGQFHILDNLIHILEMNSDSLNDANNYLYVELKELQTFVKEERGRYMLNHYLGLTASTEVICYQAVPILCTGYMEEDELEEYTNLNLNDILIHVIGQIKMIKQDHGPQVKIKLYEYDYPKVDDLGFLEFFLGHLKELQGHEKMSLIRSEIEVLHTYIHCLVSSPKTSQENLTSKGLWTHIVRLAYQAEYLMDLYLVIPDSSCISTLCIIVEEVNEIKEKLLALPVKDVSLTTSSHVHRSLPDVNNVFVGFREDIDCMMKYLSGGENDLQVISVVGMAGAGKTFLAMHLFNEASLVGHFDIKVWCTVSQNYQMKDILLTILNQINLVQSDDTKEMDDQELADKLCRSLKRRRYLVVIDDVWDVSLWNDLCRYFPNDKTQSRILITTRDLNVASKTKSKIHDLRALTDDESWELLKTKLPQQQSLPKNLVGIAKKVARSCKGLPLSIVIIGGLMHNTEKNEKMWNQIAKDVTSTILSDPQGKCEDILELSYNLLPNHLKSCFLYLGVFPEDREISVTHLVRLWVAEGLVRGGITSVECLEDVGKRYVDDLISRSLVIPRKEKTEGGVQNFQLHDLLRDFCLKKAKEEKFLIVLNDKGIFDISVSPRRICIHSGMENRLPFISLNIVRSIISFCKSKFIDFDIERILQSEHMMLLNVLDVQDLINAASYVHCFVHLRYLAIWKMDYSNKDLVKSSISKLWNLQVLILCFPRNHVFEVPEFIWDLVKLRHVHLRQSALFSRPDSKRFEDSPVLLENLKSLSKLRLHYGDSKWLCKLPELQKLSCLFFYSSDEIILQQYGYPQLDLCNRLTSLKVENWTKRTERGRCKLQLPASLRKLSLSKFFLDSDDISGIGKSLPNLEVLKLHDSIVKWSVNDEDFPKLKFLKISGGNFNDWDALHDFIENWEGFPEPKLLKMTRGKFKQWDASDESFPNLEKLWLERCYLLKGIPLSFGDIPRLRLISIKDCNPSVSQSAWDIQKIQVEAQNLELKVKIESTKAYQFWNVERDMAISSLIEMWKMINEKK